MKRARITFCLAALLAIAPSTHAADFTLTGNQHLDVTTSYNYGYLWDFSTANVLTNGRITRAYVNNEATLDVSDGIIEFINTHDDSTVNASGGSISVFLAYENSTVNISGTSVHDLYIHDNSNTNITSGNVDRIFTYETNKVDISGGSVSELTAVSSSTVNVSGGSVGTLKASSNSTVDISGASTVGGLTVTNLRFNGPQRVNISNGTVGTLRTGITLYDNEYLNYATDFTLSDLTNYGVQATSGSVSSLYVTSFATMGTSTLDISESDSDELRSITARESSTVNFFSGAGSHILYEVRIINALSI